MQYDNEENEDDDGRFKDVDDEVRDVVGRRQFGHRDRVVLIESNGHANSSPTLYSALGVILSWRDDTISCPRKWGIISDELVI